MLLTTVFKSGNPFEVNMHTKDFLVQKLNPCFYLKLLTLMRIFLTQLKRKILVENKT